MSWIEARRQNNRERTQEARRKHKEELVFKKRTQYKEECPVNLKISLESFSKACLLFERHHTQDLLNPIMSSLACGGKYITVLLQRKVFMCHLFDYFFSSEMEKQLLAHKVFINIACGSEEESLRISQAIGNELVRCLQHENSALQDLAAWTCGNLVGNHPAVCQLLFSKGFEDAISDLITSDDSTVIQSSCYALTKYLITVPGRMKYIADEAVLSKLFQKLPSDPDGNLCWTLFLFSTDREIRQFMVQSHGIAFILRNFAQILKTQESDIQVQTALLRVIANCIAGDLNSLQQVILEQENFSYICDHLSKRSYYHLQKETIQCVANLVNRAKRDSEDWAMLEESVILKRLSPVMKRLRHLCGTYPPRIFDYVPSISYWNKF